MRVLLVASRYLPHRGGLERVTRELAGHLRDAGYEVIAVTNRYPTSLPAQEEIDNVSVTRLLFLYPDLQFLRSGRLDLFVAGLVFLPLTLLRLYIILRHFRPDVVNLHYVGAPALFVWALRRLRGFRLVVSLHGSDVIEEPHQSRLKRWLFGAVLAQAERVTTCSHALLAQALKLAPAIRHKTHVIHNGVNIELFANAPPYSHPRPYLLTVGRLSPPKGIDVLIEAFGQMAGDLPDVDVLIAGDGPERAALEARIRACRLDGRVILLGAVGRKGVARLMRGCLAVVIPSRREAFGIVGLEAMAAGCPIIARRVGGLVEALEGAEVTWVMDDSPASLADALRKAVEGGARPAAPISANQDKARAFAWHAVAERYMKVLVAARSS